ncbi:nuclear transport factor 2 family protein [Gordonia zhaorongruii]|uniref:nuclear transport factor 2 family protein n=1 Tax=Gordonia zhaorongruii TaxID=2597659 RepID=UPI00104A0274|nr:nuclear transport factor 2 family protein [Gordonia zhaorongruii]
MTTDPEVRLQRVEDRQELGELALLYFHIMDERDLSSLSRIFTDDAHLGSGDGVFDVTGRDAIAEVYAGRFDALGPTFHYSHGLITGFDDSRPDTATGLLTGHAELVRNGVVMLVALRYRDTYRRTSAGWRIADREMSYFYYCPADRYVEVMGTADRNLAYGDARPADWPSILHGGDLDWLAAVTSMDRPGG